MPIKTTRQIARAVGLLALGATFAAPVRAKLSAEQLAKTAQNPIGNLISLPLQDNKLIFLEVLHEIAMPRELSTTT